MRNFTILTTIFAILLSSCGSVDRATAPPEEDVIIEYNQLDTLDISAPLPDHLKNDEEYTLPKHNPSHTRTHDLLHTKLDLRFNWPKQEVIGKATLELQPYFYATNTLELDAVNFDIRAVRRGENDVELQYTYDDQILRIDLGKSYKKEEKYTVFIDYVAHPAEEAKAMYAGAITSNQGLFFINADGKDPEKPQQIWTQGETEYNSRWFPTIDKPNERCTQEIYLTVDEKYNTLSNGLKISSINNGDGTRTDYWKQDQPHAPYLFMIAVGEFAIVKDKWENIDIEYYVDPEYESSARDIFSHTIEMLDFFSEKLDMPYPWDKYAQIVVRDFVSGAMENTSAVIFGDFVQKTSRELIDNHNERIVAHELFHHWFGDLVTCESWANLTMNEGFANYSEYLWFEHKYGKDAANHHLMNELNGYMRQATYNAHDLIYYDYDDKEETFDAHSYNKGGLVLHMLRNYVGDEAFWKALHKYLKDNAYSDVEAHELRLAFEDVTGQDFNWFFDQWYFSAGHPILDISYDYDADAEQIHVTLVQEQAPAKFPPIFVLPFHIDIYENENNVQRHAVTMNKRVQTFSFPVSRKPLLVNVDADHVILGEKKDRKSQEQLAFQFQHCSHFMDRYEVIDELAYNGSNSTGLAQEIYTAALDDPYWAIRRRALQYVNTEDAVIRTKIEQIATNDSRSQVRAAAINVLSATNDARYIAVAKQAIDNEKSYTVISAALSALINFDKAEAERYAQKLEREDNAAILAAVGKIYAENPDKNKLPFFESGWQKVRGREAISFFKSYQTIVLVQDDATIRSALEKLKTVGSDIQFSPWSRIAATRTVGSIRTALRERGNAQPLVERCTAIIVEIREREENEQVKDYYGDL